MSIIENKEPFTISHKGKLINFDKNKQSKLKTKATGTALLSWRRCWISDLRILHSRPNSK